jgi:hypothetical protein
VPRLTQLDRRSGPLLTQTRLASSCQNQVILPWTHDKLQDPVFPATGPVYEDSLKVLPGLAGESRTGDANGQWFRVLVSGGMYAYPGGGGDVMLAGQPLLGVNPPAAPRPPLREDVPCETQEQPDLRTHSSPVTGGRRAEIPASKQDEFKRITERTVRQVRRLLDRQGLSDKVRVTTRPATDAVLQTLRSLKERALHATPEARP